MVVEAKKLRVGMNYCLFGNVISHLWLLTREAICSPAGLQLETCGIAVGSQRDCIWKPAGLLLPAGLYSRCSKDDCSKPYRWSHVSRRQKVLLGHFELGRVHTRLYEVLFLSANIEENIVLFCVLKKNIYLCLKFHTFYKAMRLADRCGWGFGHFR